MHFYMYHLHIISAFCNAQICFKILALAKQLDWSERQVERWLRLRRSQDKPSTLTKFCENRLVITLIHCVVIYINNIHIISYRLAVGGVFIIHIHSFMALLFYGTSLGFGT